MDLTIEHATHNPTPANDCTRDIRLLLSMPSHVRGAGGVCSNPRYSWVSYFTLSNFCNFSQLVLSSHPLLLYQFCHLINISSSYQTSVIFSPFVIYSLFILSTHSINAPDVHTTNTTLSFLSYHAHALCAKTLSLLIRRLWPSCHSDMGGSRHGWGFFA